MNVANLENCKRLYELSGWGKTDVGYLYELPIGTIKNSDTVKIPASVETAPAYDLGYLLRRLPKTISLNDVLHWLVMDLDPTEWWTLYYKTHTGEDYFMQNIPFADITAETPEEAACLLAIKLFEEGILTK